MIRSIGDIFNKQAFREQCIKRLWEKVVGHCHAATTLRTDWREQLARCHCELGSEYMRFHDIFNDDIGIVKKPFQVRNVCLA